MAFVLAVAVIDRGRLLSLLALFTGCRCLGMLGMFLLQGDACIAGDDGPRISTALRCRGWQSMLAVMQRSPAAVTARFQRLSLIAWDGGDASSLFCAWLRLVVGSILVLERLGLWKRLLHLL